MKTFLLVLQACLLIAFLVLLLYLAWRNRQFKQRQQTILSQMKGQRFWRIHLARPEYMSRWLRIMPYEATGVLIDGADHLKIQSYWQASGQFLDTIIPRSQLSVQWLGNTSMRSGNLYWAKLGNAQEHFFYQSRHWHERTALARGAGRHLPRRIS